MTPLPPPHLFVRTRGGRVIHANDCPTLKTAKEVAPWRHATRQGWDYETILGDEPMARFAELGNPLLWSLPVLAQGHAAGSFFFGNSLMSVRWFWTNEDGWTQMGPPICEHTVQIGFDHSSVTATPVTSDDRRSHAGGDE